MTQGSETDRTRHDVIALSGDLTFSTVSTLYKTLTVTTEYKASELILDLTEVSTVDSAGLALLLEWCSQLPPHQSMRVCNAPANLLKLARLCEATHLLPMEGREKP